VVAIAAERAEPADIEWINRLLGRARECADAGVERLNQFLQADKELHLSFAQISGNPIYFSVMKMVHENIHRYHERFLSMDDREMKENYQDLEEIVKAVVRGEPGEARQLAQAHVLQFNHYMKQQEQ